ncbi:MAG: PilZ domain [Firmicutes bacterium]|nr:PilZ domain [Bacillota bacterium]
MKLLEIPINTLVELQFYYMGERFKVGVGLLYKNAKAVYVSAIKNAGKTIPATHLFHVHLTYKTNEGLYIFKNVGLRSMSYNGQKLYVVQSDNEALIVDYRKSYRLYIGKNINAKIITESHTESLRCILKDISMNGMGILSNNQIDQKAKIEISFRVNKNNKETLTGMIIRVDEFKNGTGYQYACEFTEPNDTIGKFVAYQIEKMNKSNAAKRSEA